MHPGIPGEDSRAPGLSSRNAIRTGSLTTKSTFRIMFRVDGNRQRTKHGQEEPIGIPAMKDSAKHSVFGHAHDLRYARVPVFDTSGPVIEERVG